MAIEISLCMIVKNEEENLPRCLESVKDLIDEIIIVDTGSIDKTVEIAKNYGAKVYYFEWSNDFSAARNESLKYATKDWILIMDADDEFCREDKEKFKILTENLDKNTIYFFETLCYYGAVKSSNLTINLNPRLFKNNYDYYYEGAVHNQLRNSGNSIKGKNESIRIYHYGYLDDNIINKDKRRRNITILEEQIKKEPKNKFHYFNLGNEYFSLEDKEKALQSYYKAYEEFDPTTGFSSKLIERIVITNYYLRYYNKALEFVEIGLEFYPEFTDLYYLKGLILNSQNKPFLAIKAFEKCMELGEPPAILKSIYGTGSFKASYELAQIFMKLKDYDTAYKFYVETIKLKPDFLAPLYNIARILKEKQTPPKEFKKTIENFFTDFPRAYPIVADLFFTEGYYKIALEYIEKCEEAKIFSQSFKLFKVKCLIRLSKYDECIKYIYNIPCDNSYYFQIMMYNIICFVIMNKYELALFTINQFNDNNSLDNNERVHTSLAERVHTSSIEQNSGVGGMSPIKYSGAGDMPPINQKVLQVYKQFLNLFTDNSTSILSEDENEKDYTSSIFEICEILLVNKEFNKFEKALNLLNLISDKSVLLQLGKLYNKYGYIGMAKKEIIRSIKLFDIMDAEALDILKIGVI